MKTLLQKYSNTLLLLGVVFIFSLFFSLNSEQENLDNYLSVSVSAGETLWQLAERYETGNLTKAEFIDWIEEKNDLRAESIQPGDNIVIPVAKIPSINTLASE